MKFIHCADLHLNSKMAAFLSQEQADERRAELLITFQRMVQYAKNNGISKIMIAGDLYDSSAVSSTAANVIADTICRNPEIDFFYLKGNHDADVILRAFHKIPSNLKLFGTGWTRYILQDRKQNPMAAVTITGRELMGKNDGEDLRCPLLNPDTINIVLLHGQLVEHPSEEAWSIPADRLKHKNIDYLALGHVHKHQEGELDERGTWAYPGCLEGRGFDECGEHGFLLLDIDRSRHTIKREFIPFASRRLYTIRVDVSGLLTTEEVCRTAEERIEMEGPSSADMISLILEGRVGADFELNINLLQKQLEKLCYVMKVRDETRICPEDGTYALDQSLKGEFVRLVKARNDLDDRMKAEVIRCGIAHLMGER